MKDRLRIPVSGIRGEVPDALHVDIASKFASAFAAYLETGTVAVCRDCRPSSEMLQRAVLAAVMAAGLDGADFGCLPVSFLQFLMRRNGSTGGIAVSAGHNPLPWNAVLLLNQDGCYLEAAEGSEVFNIYEAEDFQKAEWRGLGRVRPQTFPLENYLAELSRIVDPDRVRAAGFKVVADPCNGVLSSYLTPYAEHYGLKLTAINDIPEKPFPHPPEPSPENASQTEAVVRAVGADLGFLFNSDGSRLSLVDERGSALSEEATVPLCLLALEGSLTRAVTTVASSAWMDWAAERTGIRLLRTRVGQSAVTHLMEAEGAEAGGEGSGSFAYAPFSSGYDGMLALTLILGRLAESGRSLSQLCADFPPLFRRKLKIAVPPYKIYRVMDRLEESYSSEKPDITDGIRIRRGDLWFLIRPSSTEFILRIMIEGRDADRVAAVEDELRERIAP